MGAAGQIEMMSFNNTMLTSDLLQYLMVDGVRDSGSFEGAEFLQTRFVDERFVNVTGGQRLGVFRNESSF